MKKAKLLFSALFALIAVSLSAQNIPVSGTVTDAATGEGASFAAVQVKGTSIGTIADANGVYSLSAPANGTLVFSSLGYTSVEVPVAGQRTVNAVLTPDAESLDQVVVTAQGLTRKEKAIGYSTVKIDGEDLTLARQTDLGQSLAGKVAGARFFTASGATFDSGSIVLRGTTSFNNISGDEPIYVVDGTITNKNAVNMDDIESVNVLKGPAATALYGSQGGNGAVIITTRRAQAGESHIEFSHTVAMETFYQHAKIQKLYGGGSLGLYGQYYGMQEKYASDDTMSPAFLFGTFYGKNEDGSYIADHEDDENWGPRYDDTTMVAEAYYYDPTHPKYHQATPWSYMLDLGDLYQTGWTNTTNVAFSKAVQGLSTRVSFTNSSRSGIVPNSRADRRYLTANTNFTPTSWLRASLDYKFTYRKTKNASGEGYSSDTNQLDDFLQWGNTNVDLKEYKNFKRPDGSWTTWNPTDAANGNLVAIFHDNPYAIYHTRNSTTTYIWNVITGDIEASLPLNIKLGFRVMGNIRNYTSENKYSEGSINYASYYGQSKNNTMDLTYQARLTWGDYFANDRLHLDAALFVEQEDYHYTNLSANTADGLTINDYFNLNASNGYKAASNSETNYRTRSIFGNATVAWDDTYFLDLSLRNDWDSRLPSAANSYLYGGASVSVVLSQLIKADWLRFWKLRASAAQVGSTLGAYATTYTYGAGTKYNTTATLSMPNTQLNPLIKPTISTSYEIGTEFRLFNNRLRGDINFYRRDSKNQILNVDVAAQSGFNRRQLNAGLIRNQGIEITLGGTLVKTRDFAWDLDLNISKNVNTLEALSDDLTRYELSWNRFYYAWGVDSIVGHPVGEMYTKARMKHNENGLPVLQKTTTASNQRYWGEYQPVYEYDVEKFVGNFQPLWTGGFNTSFRIKNLTIGANFDFSIGGKIVSWSNLWGIGSGILEGSANVNDKGINEREPVAKGGGVHVVGVDTEGNPVDTYINSYRWYHYLAQYDNDSWVYDRSYLKLREVSIGYTFPKSVLNKMNIGLTSATISLVASNPWLIYSAVPNIDVSEAGSNWLEGGQAPSSRSFGATLRLVF